ncbi:PREDICTED: uncharacterized protein LOC106783919 [Polistes canadensis]|uniref:uncharacterized protein LOC106783919 n=1 Tax=Polistes canadensis TaxID=91411 RepID=UPI000718CB74|nr:PREDICTED: uncharacterized protein LOC106783919 [Polistes canadensis]
MVLKFVDILLSTSMLIYLLVILEPFEFDDPVSIMAGYRRVNLVTTNETMTGSSIASNMIGESSDNAVDTLRSTTRQKVRRVYGEQKNYQKNEKTHRARSSVVNNYSIVASRGELSRNNYTVDATSKDVTKKRASFLNSSKIYAKESSPRTSVFFARDLTGKNSKDIERTQISSTRLARTYNGSSRLLAKSASVPAILDEGLRRKEKSFVRDERKHEEGILKRSSAFLASLTQAGLRSAEKRDNVVEDSSWFPESLRLNGYRSSRYSTLKGYFSNTNSENELRPVLGKSSGSQILSTSWKKNVGVNVKKSVSFSSDTSFEEKRAPYRKPTVHEVKVYHKGVLQDRATREDNFKVKVPPSWEIPSEGPKALLRAAMEADDTILKEVVMRARKSDLCDVDVNMTDSSGRTAISYMAGNGAAAMLELALSFEGADVNLPDNEGNTPLHFAAQAGQTECLNVLLQRCPDIEVDARNTLGFTPLMKAALQGRTKCAKILLFAGANPTLRDHGRGLRAEQWARFCGRYVCAEVIERFARHRLLERTTSCRWGSEPELAAKVLQGKVTPIPITPLPTSSTGLKSRIRKVFRTSSGPDRSSFSLVSQLTSAALCASSPALPKNGQVPPVVKSLLRPLSVPQLRITLVSPQDFIDKNGEKCGGASFAERIESAIVKPPRTKKKSK